MLLLSCERDRARPSTSLLLFPSPSLRLDNRAHLPPADPFQQVKTAVPSWDRNVDGGNRPLSSATDGAPGAAAAGCADNVADGNTEEGREHLKPNEITPHMKNHSRPSSAAFRGWIKARPGARSAVSAVSSARTLGMDDPELVHLQLEMESRRGGMSESTLARVCMSSYMPVLLCSWEQRWCHLRQRAVEEIVSGGCFYHYKERIVFPDFPRASDIGVTLTTSRKGSGRDCFWWLFINTKAERCVKPTHASAPSRNFQRYTTSYDPCHFSASRRLRLPVYLVTLWCLCSWPFILHL